MKRILPLVLALAVLVAMLAVTASASVYDPYEYGTVTIDGDNEIVHVGLDVSGMYWLRYHNGTASYGAYGQTLTYNTQMRYLDNDLIVCSLFGKGYYVESAGIPSGSTISGSMNFGVNFEGLTQSFGASGNLHLKTYDANYTLLANHVISTDDYPDLDGNFLFSFDFEIDASLLSGTAYWQLDFITDFYGVANEDDTVTITVTSFGESIDLAIPYSSLYQLKAQGEKTNALLGEIDAQLQSNGQKLDDIMQYEPTPEVPTGADSVGDLGDIEDDIMGDVSDDLDSALNAQDNALAVLGQYLASFAAVSYIFERFSNIPVFTALLSVSLALGVSVVLFGIITSVRSSREKPAHTPKNNSKRS